MREREEGSKMEWRLEEVVGSGLCGEVRRATSNKTGKQVEKKNEGRRRWTEIHKIIPMKLIKQIHFSFFSPYPPRQP